MNRDLTVLVLSCRRLPLLERTVEAARDHFSRVERIPVTWVCFDNGSSAEDQDRIRELGFDLLMLSKENLGQGPALNRLVSAVRTRHFLLLEDDWLLENPRRLPFVQESVAILEAAPQLGQLKLDQAYFTDFSNGEIYGRPVLTGASRIPICVQKPSFQWAGFCCPPAITKTQAVRDVGPFREDHPFRRWWAESEFCARFGQRYLVAKSPELLLFKHIGDVPSAGWKDQEALPTNHAPC